MFFKGAGKECRLHAQKLNELRGVKEQMQFDDDNQLDESTELIQSSQCIIESSEQNFDSNWNGIRNVSPSEYTTFQENYYKEMSETEKRGNYIHENEDSGAHSSWGALSNRNESLGNILSNSTDECDGPVNKKRKVDINEHQSEWTKYLPDESDEENESNVN